MMRTGAEISAAEDPLTYLPRKPVQEFDKGRIIYSPQDTVDRLYLVVLGRVKVSSVPEGNHETVSRIICPEGIFGEAGLIGTRTAETAFALDPVSLMSWTRTEIEQQIEREPRLGIALIQCLARLCMTQQNRIESMALHKTPERVMVALAHLAERLGTPAPDGAIRLGSLTHLTIAEYVGTSREIVTYQMNRLRKLGLIRYSRRHIDVWVEPLQEKLAQHGIRLMRDPGPGIRRATRSASS